MGKRIYTKIIGSGSYIPDVKISNDHFLSYQFFDPSTGKVFDKSNEEIIEKFREITGIVERRWVKPDQVTSDIAAHAISDACNTAGIDKEDLDFIVIGHNFGDIPEGSNCTDVLPGLANKVKEKLKIRNPGCICMDIISGCPGWTQGMIVADSFIKSGFHKRGVVVGADVLSRISDPYDRDSMIYADGAGAVIVEAKKSRKPVGIVSHSSRSDSIRFAGMLTLGPSSNPEIDRNKMYIKMLGHKLYLYAINHVPEIVKDSIEKAGIELTDIKKVLIHQANAKMDDAMLSGLFKLYKKRKIPEDIMPMSIFKLGNSSTATVPTIYDLIMKGKMDGHEINKGDYILFISVGAGMNINSIVYKVPVK
ncbi:MAG: ketoacyl-ACP synthase III [Prolixibacteraceae bacterium]|nr:ketoacyl-ACP synthase III [Prolixibacteraceae bacterium]MBN2775804.1 ketoacyl-ACP synthase III [Prolixibacteraceae bacterium]